MSKATITPRVLKGFRDMLPEQAIFRQRLLRAFSRSFERFGFTPIETPALEYAEILLGKGSDENDKLMYRFKDHGDRDVALRFDLTIPLARYIALHVDKLGLPFKRFHIGSVWRADKPQRGRFREFIQCDFDTIGSESSLADAEVLAIADSALSEVDIDHVVRLNNRKLLHGLLETVGVLDRSTSVLRAMDKLEKLGVEVVVEELRSQAGLNDVQLSKVLSYLELARGSLGNSDVLREVQKLISGSSLGERGCEELSQLLQHSVDLGIGAQRISIDLAIARGLDYYTGTVFEFQSRKLPDIGSVGGGGRYDDLASLFTKRRLPGVGGSIGLDRLVAACEELGMIENRSSPAQLFVALLDDGSAGDALKLAHRLRSRQIAVETSLEPGPLGPQIKYAAKRGVPFVAIFGKTEIEQGSVALKVLATGEQTSYTESELLQVLERQSLSLK